MSKKKVWLIVGIVVAVLIAVYIIAVATGNVKPTDSNSESNSAVSQGTIASSGNDESLAQEYGWDMSMSTKEEGTSDRVDEILLKSKEDAEKISEEDAEKLWDESFKYLKEHSNNFYASNEVMEKSMYYGGFLYEYVETNANASNVDELVDSTRAAYDAGWNTVKAIKYVYRGAENIEDESTQNALSKAQEALNKFN